MIVTESLGNGAQYKVYKARYKHNDVPFAIKVLKKKSQARGALEKEYHIS